MNNTQPKNTCRKFISWVLKRTHHHFHSSIQTGLVHKEKNIVLNPLFGIISDTKAKISTYLPRHDLKIPPLRLGLMR